MTFPEKVETGYISGDLGRQVEMFGEVLKVEMGEKIRESRDWRKKVEESRDLQTDVDKS